MEHIQTIYGYNDVAELAITRKESMQIASELCYSDKVISMIKQANSVNEINNIMADARKGNIK